MFISAQGKLTRSPLNSLQAFLVFVVVVVSFCFYNSGGLELKIKELADPEPGECTHVVCTMKSCRLLLIFLECKIKALTYAEPGEHAIACIIEIFSSSLDILTEQRAEKMIKLSYLLRMLIHNPPIATS